MERFIDLHIHTVYSDGTLTPEKIVHLARDKGLSAIGFTDHDITDGIPVAVMEGAKYGIEVVPGVELSAQGRGNEDDMHILGYYINWDDKVFQDKLRLFRQARERRAYHILDKLYHMGIRLKEGRLFEIAGIGSISRLHFAKALIEEGHVKTIKDAFDKYLGAGRPAFVPKLRLSPSEAIQMIIRVGGIPVLAHPGLGKHDTKRIISKLQRKGLKGVEVYHPTNSPGMEQKLNSISEELKLICTGGSDCHGSLNGSAPVVGKFKVPYDCVVKMKEYMRSVDGPHILK